MNLVLLYVFFVSFADKPVQSVPALSERAIEQRTKWNIPIDELDYPVSQVYVDSIVHMGATLCHTTRWFNGATFAMTQEQADHVAQLDFVSSVEMTRDNSSSGGGWWWSPQLRRIQAETKDYWTDEQLALYNLMPLHEAGYKGKGILMSVCDGGFHNANSLSCFRHNLELGHFDFTDDSDGFYGSTGDHGTECLSTISGMAKEQFMGAATQAEYYLMRSEEYATESPKEMDNLVAALECSDSLGVNVFSVSLGYAMFDNDDWTLPKSAMDGKTTRCSRAATIAARKGMLVCVAAGNEGSSSWRTISAPADADSILTVGAVDEDGVIGSFSSYGPSADGRIKPEVCAVGVATTLISPNGYIMTGNGTSFATPLIAGMAASLWSALPDENAMQIRERIIRSADRYDTPDPNQYGYGIPDAWYAYTMDQPQALEETTTANHTEHNAQKIIRGEQVLIVRFGHIYNLAGQRIE